MTLRRLVGLTLAAFTVLAASEAQQAWTFDFTSKSMMRGPEVYGSQNAAALGAGGTP